MINNEEGNETSNHLLSPADETEREPIKLEKEKFSFAAGILMQKWCRHQYLKGLFPTMISLWYWIIFYISYDYQTKASNYIKDELSEYNCTTIDTYRYSGDTCYTLDSRTQYMYSDNSGLSTITVNCTSSGANLYYPKDYYDTYSKNFYLQLFINFLLPLIATYFIYETLYLGLYDCLVVLPGLNQFQEPILCYASRSSRISLFFLRDIFCSDPIGSSPRRFHSKSLLPGIRIGRFYSFMLNLFTYATLAAISEFILATSDIHRCMKQSAESLHYSRNTVFTLLPLYLTFAAIPTIWYYHRLIFRIGDIELLALQYREEFLTRRCQGIRNILDLIPALFLPAPFILLYFGFWLLPMYICSWICYFYCLLISISSSLSSRALYEKKFANYFRRTLDDHAFYPYISWCCRLIDEDGCREYCELQRDDTNSTAYKAI